MPKFTVHQGRRYRATVNLSWVQQQFATNQKIAKIFKDLGFIEVKVAGAGAKREATGLWPLPDATTDVPSELHPIDEIEA